MSDYGKKGGSGPTAGKQAATFKAEFEGVTYSKRTFSQISGPAVMVFYRHAGKVYPNAVFAADAIPCWASEAPQAPATRRT